MNSVIEESNWKVHYKLTESAGVQIYLADYAGKRVLWEGSLPYVTIDHQRDELAVAEDDDEAALQNGRGTFWVPLGRRTLAGDVRVSRFRGGFEIAADFVAGPYQYTQLWRFHDSGRLDPWLTIHGSGLHDAHTYHPHWRFDFDVDGALDDALEHFDGEHWNRVATEGWLPYTGGGDPDSRAVWRQVDFPSGGAVNIRPSHWEDAELYAVRYHDGEWAPFSPRSEAGAQPFPEAYVGDEPIDGQDVTLWYVSHVHYDQSFPFTAGPWIRLSGY